jgi:hypothetical protein
MKIGINKRSQTKLTPVRCWFKPPLVAITKYRSFLVTAFEFANLLLALLHPKKNSAFRERQISRSDLPPALGIWKPVALIASLDE